MAQVSAWADEFRPFRYEETDPAVADAMTIRLAFNGTGGSARTEGDLQAMLAFCADLYASLSQ